MKKLLLSLLACGAVAGLTSTAQAGQFARVYAGNGYCGPVYTYVPKAALYGYGSGYCADDYQPRYYRAPVCHESYGYHRRVYRDCRPRISFSFGF